MHKQQTYLQNSISIKQHLSCFIKPVSRTFGLGVINFPQHAFADKNFHCGYYADGDDLQNIVHFRKHNLEDCFKMEAAKVSGFKKTAAKIFKKPIKWYLLKQSEPYQTLYFKYK